jgi:hypothetical protein
VCVCVDGGERERQLFFSICVSAKEGEREGGRQGGVVFPSFVPSNEKRQHKQTEELLFSPTLILVFGVLNLEEKNHTAGFRV